MNIKQINIKLPLPHSKLHICIIIIKHLVNQHLSITLLTDNNRYYCVCAIVRHPAPQNGRASSREPCALLKFKVWRLFQCQASDSVSLRLIISMLCCAHVHNT